MGPLNDLGLLKMDFLGLKTLTVIEDTLALIHKREPEFPLKNIPLDDPAAFALYNRGETIGLFQMESGGMTSLSRQFDVKKLDDSIALIALYRPCLLYTSDAADERSSVDLGGRRIIKK